MSVFSTDVIFDNWKKIKCINLNRPREIISDPYCIFVLDKYPKELFGLKYEDILAYFSKIEIKSVRFKVGSNIILETIFECVLKKNWHTWKKDSIGWEKLCRMEFENIMEEECIKRKPVLYILFPEIPGEIEAKNLGYKVDYIIFH